MQSDKYFQPDPQDLHVGYECEVFLSEEVTDVDFGWTPHIMKPVEIRRGVEKIRTPYLTKEQVEKEGWEYVSFRNTKWTFKKGINRIALDRHRDMIIYQLAASNRYLFQGKCPSINEFRKICKLLGI